MALTLEARSERVRRKIQGTMDGEEQGLKMIQSAIQRFVEEKKEDGGLSDGHVIADEDDRLLLSRLLSQLELIKAGSQQHSPSSVSDTSPSESTEASEVCTRDEVQSSEKPVIATEEILKELRSLKRQNRITHWLLWAAIVTTALWRLSEISLVLVVKQKINHPFKALGNLLFGAFKNPLFEANNRMNTEKIHNLEVPSLTLPKIPDLPCVDISSLNISSTQE